MLDWIDRLFGSGPWATTIVWIIAIGGTLFFIVRFLRKAWADIVRFVTTINSITGLPEFIERTDKTLAGQDKILATQNRKMDAQNLILARQDTKILEIHHEVHFNNGSSVKDGVRRAEEAIDRVERGVKGLYDHAQAADEATAQLRADLEDTHPKPPTKENQ